MKSNQWKNSARGRKKEKGETAHTTNLYNCILLAYCIRQAEENKKKKETLLKQRVFIFDS